MAAEIISVQASHTRMSPEEISDGIRKIYDALKSIEILEGKSTRTGTSEEVTKTQVVSELALTPKDSIQRTKIICLECGKSFKQISNRHLVTHSMDAKTYRKKHDFPTRQSLSARELTLRRRKMAKERHLGEKLKEARRKKVTA